MCNHRYLTLALRQCCPTKKHSKTLIILHISLKRHPDGLTYAIDINKQIYQKRQNVHRKKSKKLQREAQFGQVKHAFEATHSDSRAKNSTLFLMSN